MGGGGIIGGKNFFGPNFVFLRLWRQHPFLHKTKSPTRNPISPTPPSFGGRPCHPPPPRRRAIFRSPWDHSTTPPLFLRCHLLTENEKSYRNPPHTSMECSAATSVCSTCCATVVAFIPHKPSLGCKFCLTMTWTTPLLMVGKTQQTGQHMGTCA